MQKVPKMIPPERSPLDPLNLLRKKWQDIRPPLQDTRCKTTPMHSFQNLISSYVPTQ